jgi:hypothetical protein
LYGLADVVAGVQRGQQFAGVGGTRGHRQRGLDVRRGLLVGNLRGQGGERLA